LFPIVPTDDAGAEKAIRHALNGMTKGLPWDNALPWFQRDEMHER